MNEFKVKRLKNGFLVSVFDYDGNLKDTYRRNDVYGVNEVIEALLALNWKGL